MKVKLAKIAVKLDIASGVRRLTVLTMCLLTCWHAPKHRLSGAEELYCQHHLPSMRWSRSYGKVRLFLLHTYIHAKGFVTRRDCLRRPGGPMAGMPGQQQGPSQTTPVFDSEYASLMAELGEAPKEGAAVQQASAISMAPWRNPANW